ncbi:hypothetical protein DPEC_G00083200 [Dallia pectoralis]|uniref:Uncharacterized protein n=1 Tax=Dallia pectoralis TaxID=75939 RepID=A0ACC2GYZ4_DALPE|nr:hypothetical protein DPEC_G00083200 [Dallia pectoralis]
MCVGLVPETEQIQTGFHPLMLPYLYGATSSGQSPPPPWAVCEETAAGNNHVCVVECGCHDSCSSAPSVVLLLAKNGLQVARYRLELLEIPTAQSAL